MVAKFRRYGANAADPLDFTVTFAQPARFIPMKPTRLLALLATSVSALFTLSPSNGFAADKNFDTWAETFSADWVRSSPTFSTIQQYLPAGEQDSLDRQLTKFTKEARAERVAKARAGLAELAKFDRASLDAQQKVSAATIEWSLQGIVEAEPFADYNFVFNQFGGLHVNIVNFMSQSHPIRNKRDIENYLARLELV
ncbi:MAG: DUF885 family protein, partial [Opitutus sp.]